MTMYDGREVTIGRRCWCWPTAACSRARRSVPTRTAASPPARSCSTPRCPATRRSSPTRATPGRSSRSPIRTSATTASTPTTTRRGRPFCRGVIVRDLARRRSNWRATDDLDALPAPPRHPRHRRHRHPPPHPPPPRRRRDARRVRHRRSTPRCSRRPPAEAGTDGIDLVAEVTTPEPYTVGDGAAATSSPTTSASSARSCASSCAAATSRWCRRDAGRRRRWPANPTASSSPTGPATRPWSRYATDSIARAARRRAAVRHLPRPPDPRPPHSAPSTVKLPFGHHGANHPVRHEATGRVEITSQNHNYAVDADSCRRAARSPT